MKTFKKIIYKQERIEVDCIVTNVIHNLPTWMFPYNSIFHNENMLCPVCHQQMRIQISHGLFVEKCSMIQVDNRETYPIHEGCYFNLNENDVIKSSDENI